jgi:exonuclease SbcC
VLLAQNDFATFLKASDDERAELLQTLTGTQTYSQLSQLAYQRMKAEQDALARLQLQLADQAPLAAEDRQARVAEAAALATAQAELARQKAALDARREWFRHLATLQQAVAEAERKALDAHAARDAAAPRRAQLAPHRGRAAGAAAAGQPGPPGRRTRPGRAAL